eukprot:TRINITY_DN4258_c2_g1_i1.p1 TRINITY_DN4258_c2_g1~~TRINITY_DN4258_c2_g1_i1.p1  ORF type:complete len:360 (+),score=76.51 TRINITY_DN4258_c2_g1_i1:99-1178(+)
MVFIYNDGSPSLGNTASSKTVSSLGLGNRIAMSPSSNYGLSDSLPVKRNASPEQSSETMRSMIDILEPEPESQESISLSFPDDLQVPESMNSPDSAFRRRRRKTNKKIHSTPSPSPKKHTLAQPPVHPDDAWKSWRDLGFSAENIPVIEYVMDAVAEFERSLKKPEEAVEEKEGKQAPTASPLQLRIASDPPKIRRNNSEIIVQPRRSGDGPVKRRADSPKSKEKVPTPPGLRHVRKKKAIEIAHPNQPLKEPKKRSNTISAPKARRSKKPVDVESVGTQSEDKKRVPLKRRPSYNTNIPKRRSQSVVKPVFRRQVEERVEGQPLTRENLSMLSTCHILGAYWNPIKVASWSACAFRKI